MPNEFFKISFVKKPRLKVSKIPLDKALEEIYVEQDKRRKHGKKKRQSVN